MDKDISKKYSGFPREVKVITDMKDSKNNVTGKEQFKLNKDGNPLYSFKWDTKGNLIKAEQFQYDDKGRLKKYYEKKPDEDNVSEYFYNNKGILTRKKTKTSSDYATINSTYKYDKNGKIVQEKTRSEIYDDEGNVDEIDEYEEGEED